MLEEKINFEDFYLEYFDYIYNFVYLRVKLHHDTEDILSESFIALWKDWGKMTNITHARKLIFTIARNKTNDYLRKKYKNSQIITEFDEEKVSDEFIQTEVLDKRKNLKIKIRKFVSGLDEKAIRFFKLRYEENKKLSEISQIMMISLNYVKVINNRLIKKIKLYVK
jgi:RNA polymerase sigma-70 factor (ECF subfamily)